MEEATIDTRTLTRRLTSFSNLLDQVTTETAGPSRSRSFLSSLKASRKKKAAVSQLMDVAEALQVILSTLAKHHRSYQQLPVDQMDEGNQPSDPSQQWKQVNQHRVGPSDTHLSYQNQQATSYPVSDCMEHPNCGHVPVRPCKTSDQRASGQSTAEAQGQHCTFSTHVCDRTEIPPLQLTHLAKPLDPHVSNLADPDAGVDTSSCDSDMDFSPKKATLPIATARKERMYNRESRSVLDGFQKPCSKRFLNSNSDHLGAIQEDEVACLSGVEFACKPKDVHVCWQTADCGPQVSGRENDGFYTARSHFSPRRDMGAQQRRMGSARASPCGDRSGLRVGAR